MFNIFRKFQPHFPSNVKFNTYDNLKFIKRMPVKSSEKTFFLEAIPDKIGKSTNGITFITDRHYNVLAYHDYFMKHSPNCFEGSDMIVIDKMQGLGLGELLRLASIIEMKENGIEKIVMESVPSAMPFHIKYKLTPNITEPKDLLKALKKISSSTHSVGTFPKEAKNILDDIAKNGFSLKYFKEVNSLIAKYIRGNAGRWAETKINMQMPMCLTQNDVNKYASFYNKLFEKHGIDYRI